MNSWRMLEGIQIQGTDSLFISSLIKGQNKKNELNQISLSESDNGKTHMDLLL